MSHTTHAERIAERLTRAAADVYYYADGDLGEYRFRRYQHALRRVSLLTYALQHP